MMTVNRRRQTETETGGGGGDGRINGRADRWNSVIVLQPRRSADGFRSWPRFDDSQTADRSAEHDFLSVKSSVWTQQFLSG